MSRINAIRITNLNYNNNSLRVDDEIFELGTESTLLSLRNGGGKSVLVQMMTAPFVRKRYRDTKDRPFASYFTGNRPTYILVEWKLDGENGYVLTGMMVRKTPENKEEEVMDPLETIQFIYEYKERNDFDIYRFPLITDQEDGKKLLLFGHAKQLFEELKKNTELSFNYYDMNMPNQFRNYFDKLKEYGINHKEWESIIKRVNVKESGLSELFAEAKDESGLVEKWFLPAVEDKLCRDESKIDKFVELIQKYIRQYRENQANFAKKDIIETFKEETTTLLEIAQNYQQTVEQTETLANEIANLIQSLKQVIENLNLQIKGTDTAIEAIVREINKIECMQICSEIYGQKEEIAKLKDSLGKNQEASEQANAKITEFSIKLNRQECAKAYEAVKTARKEVEEYTAKLELIHRQDEDLTPERNNLGYSLNHHYTLNDFSCQEKQKEVEAQIQAVDEKIDDCTHSMEQINLKIQKSSEESGRLKASAKGFDQIESEFNRSYSEDLSRNILGHYEAGILEAKTESIAGELSSLDELKKDSIHENEENNQALTTAERNLYHLQEELADERSLKKQLKEKLDQYENLIQERKSVLPFVNLSEDYVFDNVTILNAFDQKIQELRKVERKVLLAEEKLTKECEQLKSGKVMELPKEIEEKLKNLDISYLYGTEWLKKNGRTQEENKNLVKSNPFLPYAIILTEVELKHLSEVSLGIHTSVPIPIVVREELEKEWKDQETNIYRFDGLSFYVSFNEKLLDKDALAELIDQKEKEQLLQRERLSTIQDERDLFDEKKNLIQYQELRKKDYESCVKEISKCEKQLATFEETKDQLMQEVENRRKLQLTMAAKLELIRQSQLKCQDKQKSFEHLRELYDQYIKEKEHFVQLEEQIQSFRKTIEELKKDIVGKNVQRKELSQLEQQILMERKEVQKRMAIYTNFTEGTLVELPLETMEARFEAITLNLHQEESELNKQLTKANNAFVKAQKELDFITKEYSIELFDYETIHYDYTLVKAYKEEQERLRGQCNQLISQKIGIEKDITMFETQLYGKLEELEKKQGSRELYSKEQLVNINYKEAVFTKYNEKTTLEKERDGLLTKLRVCQAAADSMSEFEELKIIKPVEVHLNLSEVNRLKVDLIRNYRSCKEECANKQSEIVGELARLLRNPKFQEDYYRKPLEVMERIPNQPAVIIEQLKTTISVYDNLLSKLEVDIALIEEEGLRVQEVLLQYVQEVHENLCKIDRNSTIKIRERNIKMLKITLADWEEEKMVFSSRCKDYLEELVARCLELLDENKNIEELVASYITTKNLYQRIVGMGTIKIQLYKIEESREYPITWAEVSKNSGGEGFLSAFVILSSLLSYMRREDADLFSETERGKVLIMDNPFAQTNASHLLKPLMDIAKKTNTQLICLSGLGGESIYNRFENIYVLNLVSSKLKDGLQYLHGEHTKGEDLSSIVSTRIKIEEEQMVLF